MEKAQALAKEVMESQENVSEEVHEKHMDNLKPAINNLLQMYLPAQTTVMQAESIGFVIYDMINNPNQYTK